MASVTKEVRNGRTLYRIEYRDKDKRRKKLRLGSVAKRDAQAIAAKVQSIISAQVAGNDLPTATAEWLATIGDDLHQRLAEQGLCKPRLQYSLHDWLEQFIAKHSAKVGDRCLLNLGQAQTLLERHFGPDHLLREITAEAAAGFREWLTKQGYATATIAGHIKKCKQFFGEAVKVGAINQNPFDGVAAGTQHNSERSIYVPVETIEKAIAMAPDSQWRLIIALSRYAGLRCPSETLALRWADVDFVNDTMTVTSSKTAKQGKSKRVVPILPQLRPYLEDAFDPEADRCISRYQISTANLRTEFLRILKRAEVEPWPRLFHNLRGSLETDLFEGFPAHVVVTWLGNSERIALKHYVKVTGNHLAAASTFRVGQQVGTSLAETTESSVIQGKGNIEFPEEIQSPPVFETEGIPRAGFEPATY